MSLIIAKPTKPTKPTNAQDADLPSAYKIETEVENEVKRLTQFYPTCGVSKSTIEVELPKDPKKENVDFVYKGVKQVVAKIASYARARIINETRKPDAVVFKLDKPIAQDSAAMDGAREDVVNALASMASYARMKTGMNVSYQYLGSANASGEIIIQFPNEKDAKNYNYYDLFKEWHNNKNAILPKWAWGFGGYKVLVIGNKIKIDVGSFNT